MEKLRHTKLADHIKTTLAECFMGGQLSDPRLEGMTITRVRLTKDLQLASVYFRSFGNFDNKTLLQGLQSAKGYLRNKIAESLDVRRVPNLRFFFDDSEEKLEKIEYLLQNLK